jgi:hypothetical protein
MSELLERYRMLQAGREKVRRLNDDRDSPEEDEILDMMDEVWWALSAADRRELDGDDGEFFRQAKIPEIDDGRLRELLERIRPVVSFGGVLHYIRPVDPRRIAFTWAPKPGRKAKGLVELRQVRTLHNYGHPSLFKPSIAEVLAQLPDDIADRTVAFETVLLDFDQRRDCHVATTTFFGREEK